MSYRIVRTDKAEEQLREIIYYIAADSGSIDIALNVLSKIEKAINRLQGFPESGSIPRYSILKRQGFLVLIIDKHLVFYKVDKAKGTVVIYAIVDGRQEYINLI